MNLYSAMLIGPLFFVSTWMVHVFQKGSINLFVDGALLLLFITQLIVSTLRWIPPLFYAFGFAVVTLFLGLDQWPSGVSFILSSVLTAMGYARYREKQALMAKQAQAMLGYKQLVLKAIEKEAALLDKVEALLGESYSYEKETEEGFSLEEEKKVLLAQEQEERALNALETRLAVKERGPLKRLRKVVMKQTNFLDQT